MLDWSALPDQMLHNFVRRYETGGVQPAPRLRFVDDDGRACLSAALCGARSAPEVAGAAALLGHTFRGGVLERVSRLFEGGTLTADAMYADCLLELTRRRTSRLAAGGGSTQTVATPAVQPGAPAAV